MTHHENYVRSHLVLFESIAPVLLVLGNIGFLSFFFHKTLPDIEKGSYRIIQQETPMKERVSKLLLAKDQIVIFYEDEGYEAVYSETGEFSYGIQVDKSARGYGNIAYLDDRLVIKSKPNTVYVFDGDTPTEIYPFSSEQLDPLSLLEEKMGEYHSSYYSENDEVYSVSGDSVDKTDSSGIRSVVIHVPRRVLPPVYLISFFLGLALLLYLQRLSNS